MYLFFTISLALLSAKHPKSSDKSWGGWPTACASEAQVAQHFQNRLHVRLCGLARHLALAMNWPVITGGCHVRL